MATIAIGLLLPPVQRLFHPVILAFRGKRTIEQRVSEFAAARNRMRALCTSAGVAYPPQRVVLFGLKDEQRLEVYAGTHDGALLHLTDYPVVAASGDLGPKLREGDRQVPEGVYPLESLNPNSRFHVALRVGYPNEMDKTLATMQGRTELGGDIMIHGGAASIGCLAMGDPAAEDLFVLAAETGIQNVTIVLSPVDLRTRALPEGLAENSHNDRYAAIQSEIVKLAR